MSSPLLTHSATSCLATCPRKYYLSYELGVRRKVKAEALRMGSAFHLAAELVGRGLPAAEAIIRALEPYNEIPGGVDMADWEIEREKVYRLCWGYLTIYADDGLKVTQTEMPFKLPIVDPDSGQPHPVLQNAGKIDRIVVREATKSMHVFETKTTSKDLSSGSDYWERLRIDSQITRYMYAARKLGFDVVSVIYDVIRKPATEPHQIPILDENGLKIVLDRNGERIFKTDKKGRATDQPRQSSNLDNGWTLQTRRETAQEYGDRLSADILARPEFYFARREIARLDCDLREYEGELWQQAMQLSEMRKYGRWYRNTGACLSPYRCEYTDLCFGHWKDGDPLPEKFERVENVHPELEEESE